MNYNVGKANTWQYFPPTPLILWFPKMFLWSKPWFQHLKLSQRSRLSSMQARFFQKDRKHIFKQWCAFRNDRITMCSMSVSSSIQQDSTCQVVLCLFIIYSLKKPKLDAFCLEVKSLKSYFSLRYSGVFEQFRTKERAGINPENLHDLLPLCCLKSGSYVHRSYSSPPLSQWYAWCWAD